MERVSVIMPCYNDGKYIEEAIQSVRAQTYPMVELVVIDDGSDDIETIRVLQQLCDNGCIQKFLHTNHAGPAAARNVGIAQAEGEYILPVDADDRIDKYYIEKAMSVFETQPKIGVVYCQADLFGEKSGMWDIPEYSLEKMLLDNIVFVTALFRKKDWEKVGGFRTTMNYGMEDYDFWLSLIEIGREIFQIPEVLFHYRIKAQSRTTAFMTDVSVVQKTYKEIYLQHPKLYEQYRDKYAMILREALIEQLFINRAYMQSIGALERLKKVPLIKTILKKYILKQ